MQDAQDAQDAQDEEPSISRDPHGDKSREIICCRVTHNKWIPGCFVELINGQRRGRNEGRENENES